MWLALSSIVLGTAIGCNVLALWLTGSFERVAGRQSPLTPSGTLHSEPSQPEMVLRQCRTRAGAARRALAGTGQTRKRSPALMPGFLHALYADQTDAYTRGEHYHAGINNRL
jgi:hypothetical protein